MEEGAQDVCVPLSRLAECISETKVELEASPLPCPLVSHAGDGNFHVCIFVDMTKPEELVEAQRLAENMVHRALAMDGNDRDNGDGEDLTAGDGWG